MYRTLHASFLQLSTLLSCFSEHLYIANIRFGIFRQIIFLIIYYLHIEGDIYSDIESLKMYMLSLGTQKQTGRVAQNSAILSDAFTICFSGFNFDLRNRS